MASEPAPLGAAAARQLANTTKTPPQWVGTTPRWLVSLLPWVPVEAGTYRVNKVKEADAKGIGIECSPSDGAELPHAFVDYEENPREYTLSTVTTTLEVQTRISDLYRSPMDQVREQLGVLIEMVKERQENELVNNANYGLLSQPPPEMRAASYRRIRPRRGVPPPTTTLFGSPFLTWRGIPLIPSDKLHIKDGASNILLMRTGERKRGVVGLFQPGLPGEVSPSLTVRWMGINQRGAAAYLVSLYCSAAVLTEDAVGVLENVQVEKYHEYRY
ncbi:MAG: putative nucleotide-binding protein [Polyangiaceae bacterium]|nr:putative nucleotide-binding protein [Polyangiaceae bacterium]